MGRNPASSKGKEPNPRNGSARVQKPNRSADGSTHVMKAGPVATGPAAPIEPGAGVMLAPFGVFIDWLTVNMRTPERLPNSPRLMPWESLEPVVWSWEGAWIDRAYKAGLSEDDLSHRYTVEPTNLRTAQFQHVSYVFDERREKMVTVWHTPHDNRLHSAQWIQVQFHNETLYTGQWATLFRMFRVMGCELSGISRVDIACDGLEGAGGNWPTIMQMSRDGKARNYGKCEVLTREQRGGRVVGGEFGTRRSNKFIRAYRKKREMKRKGLKRHIVARWNEQLGFDVMEDAREVNRFEVQLKGKEIRRYFPEEKGSKGEQFLLSLANTRKLVDVFASMAVEMFDYRTPEVRARDARSVGIWDWSRVVVEAPTIACRAKRNYAITDYTIKSGLRELWHMGTVMCDAQVLALAEHKAKAAGAEVVKWYGMKKEQWRKYHAKLNDAGDQRTVDYFHALARDPDGPDKPPDEWEPALEADAVRSLATGEFDNFPFDSEPRAGSS